jgi:hypothetical protein
LMNDKLILLSGIKTTIMKGRISEKVLLLRFVRICTHYDHSRMGSGNDPLFPQLRLEN